ncbi:MAG: DnaD domain protein [Eisenbergiella sp.]
MRYREGFPPGSRLGPVSAGSSKAAVPDRPARLSDSRVRQLRKDNSEFSSFFSWPNSIWDGLEPTDISRILYFYDDRFPMDLLEYLIEYCVCEEYKPSLYRKGRLEWHRTEFRQSKWQRRGPAPGTNPIFPFSKPLASKPESDSSDRILIT